MKDQNRRNFVKTIASAALVPPLLLATNQAFAQQAEKLKEDDPLALALGYKEKTTDVDAEKYPTHRVEQICSNCVLYQGDDPQWGACGAFGNKLVAGPGWCQAYAAKPS